MPPPKPPRPGHHGKRPHHHRHSLSALSSTADAETLEAALASIVPDARDREFLVRCILREGPAHHRAASWALLVLAAEIASRLGALANEVSPAVGESLSVKLRLPPHVTRDEDSTFPIRLPLAPLRAVLRTEREVEAIADALLDGPPHHALANVALVALFDRMLRRLPPTERDASGADEAGPDDEGPDEAGPDEAGPDGGPSASPRPGRR